MLLHREERVASTVLKHQLLGYEDAHQSGGGAAGAGHHGVNPGGSGGNVDPGLKELITLLAPLIQGQVSVVDTTWTGVLSGMSA